MVYVCIQALGELKEVQDDLGKKLGKREEKPTQEVARSGGSNSRSVRQSSFTGKKKKMPVLVC